MAPLLRNLVIALVTVCLALVLQVNSEDIITNMFNCKRQGSKCLNHGMCNTSTSICDCPAGYQGYDCFLNASLVLNSSTTCHCQNGGTCYHNETNGIQCYCMDAFYGDMCQNERVFHQCYYDAMEFRVVPFSNTGSFVGHIYVLDHAQEQDCQLDNVGGGIYLKKISTDKCGHAGNETTPSGDTDSVFTLVVQYDDMLLQADDQEFVFRCLIRQPDSNIEWQNSPVSTDKMDGPLQKQNVTEELVPIEMQMTTEDGQPVVGPQKIGSKLKLVFTLNGGSAYDSFKIQSITATNGLQGDRMETVDFVAAGCVTPVAGSNGKKIVTDFSGSGSSKVTLTFKLFKFRFSSQISFKNVVKICKGSGHCNATDCTDFTGLGRRKRDIQPEETDLSSLAVDQLTSDDEPLNAQFERFDAAIFVVVPGSKLFQNFHGVQQPILSNSISTPSCFQNTWIILAFIIVFLVCFALGVFVAVTLVRRNYRRSILCDTPPELYEYPRKS